MFSAFADSIDLATEARKYIKARVHVAVPADVIGFAKKYIDTGKVARLDVQAEGRVLVAHKLELTSNQSVAKIPEIKKALIYMTSNRHYVACSFDMLESLLKLLADVAEKNGKNVVYTAYCQDYRGRGFNKKENVPGKPEENWNDYPALQDAKDQEALIRKLVADGYEPENISIVCQSYGSLVSLWAMHRLGGEYKNIKIFSDKGVGNPFLSPDIKPFISDPTVAMKKLVAGNMVPPVTFHDIANLLPKVMMTRAENDKLIIPEMSLVNTFKQNEKPGQIWVLKSDNDHVDSHYDPLHFFKLMSISEINIFHLIASFINEAPIKLTNDFNFPSLDGKKFDGYQLKKNATREQKNDFVEFPSSLIEVMNEKKSIESDKDCLSISSASLKKLISSLFDYCNIQAAKAVESGSGGAYESGIFGKQWSARQKIQMAVDMITNLAKNEGPNIEYFNKLQQSDGPHKYQSGGLNKIYCDVEKFLDEYVRLQKYNAYIVSVRQEASKTVDKVKAEPTILLMQSLFSTDKNQADTKLQIVVIDEIINSQKIISS